MPQTRTFSVRSSNIFNLGVKLDGKPLDYRRLTFHNSAISIACEDQPLNIVGGQLDKFDRDFFVRTMSFQLLRCLQRLCMPYCYQLLKNIPDIGDYFVIIFRKLSVQRLNRILLDDQIYLLIFSTLYRVAHAKMPSTVKDRLEVVLQTELQQVHKRLIYFLDTIVIENLPLRSAIQAAINACIYRQIQDPQLLRKLYHSSDESHNGRKPTKRVHCSTEGSANTCNSFLTKLLKMISTVSYIRQSREEKMQPVNPPFGTYVFSDYCLKILARHFEDYFLMQQKDLMRLMEMGLHMKGRAFYESVISKSEDSMLSGSSCSQISVDESKNERILYTLMMSNIVSGSLLGETQHVMELLQDHFCERMLKTILGVLGEMLSNERLSSQQMGLCDRFLQKVLLNAHKGVLQIARRYNQAIGQFMELLMVRMEIVMSQHRISAQMSVAVLRVATTLLCHETALNCTISDRFVDCLRKLLILTKGSNGIVRGVRQTLINSIRSVRHESEEGGKSDCDSEQITLPSEEPKYTRLIYL